MEGVGVFFVTSFDSINEHRCVTHLY